MLEVRNVSKGFGEKKILQGIDITIEKGDIVGLLGKNGAGKTTLIKCINQLYCYDGSVRISGLSYAKNPKEYLRKVGILLEPSYYDYMSAMDNLRAYASLSGVLLQNIESDLKELLVAIGLADAMQKKVKEFSFGMKQKLGVAMALVKKPDVLVLDEPTIGVDPKGLDIMFDMLKKLAKQDEVAIIFSSNNLEEVQAISSKISFLKDGMIVDTLATQKMLEQGNAYTIQVRNTLPQDIKAEILQYQRCKISQMQIFIDSVDNLNRIIKILVNTDNPILDIKRENQFLRNFYE